MNRRGLPVELGVFALLVLLSGWLAIQFPAFRSTDNLKVLLVSGAVYAIVGAGMTMVIATGGIDISVGSIVGFTSTVLVSLASQHAWSIPAACAAALLCGMLCGALNGSLIAFLRVPPIIATLATFSAARAGAYIVAYLVNEQASGEPLADSFSKLYYGQWLGIPMPALIGAACLALVALFLKKTGFGRAVLALGGNRNAAYMSGLRVRRTELMVYMISGLLAAVASIVVAAREGSVNADAGKYLEFAAITAVVVGGTPIAGGKATVTGTLLGVLTIGVVQNGVISYGKTGLWQQLVLGLVLLATVEVDRWRQRRALRPAQVMG